MKKILLLVLLCGVSDSLWSQTRNSRSKNARKVNASNVEQGVTKQVDLGNYFDVPGNARCAVRLGLQGAGYSDSRDGLRICLGVVK
ncbi:MAG TPA: hypothetical protein VIQ51_00660 [Chryseosolibacter sp.]